MIKVKQHWYLDKDDNDKTTKSEYEKSKTNQHDQRRHNRRPRDD